MQLDRIRLFRTFVQENQEIWTEELKREIYLSCATIMDHEDAFIDLAFEQGAVEGLTAREVKEYIRYIADRRLMQLGLNQLYHVSKNPLPWLDEMLNAVEHAEVSSRTAPPNTAGILGRHVGGGLWRPRCSPRRGFAGA